jgi:signal peptidase I
MSDPVMQNVSSSDTPITDPPASNGFSPNAPIKKRSDRALFISVIIALALAALIRFFVAAPYVVSGTSMLPTFQNWNYLIVDKLSYTFEKPQRGDVIVLDLPQETSRALIKRIIGLPGDTVVLSGPDPTVTIINAANPNGFVLNEPYIDPANYGGISNTRYTLGPDEYFVMGDNRVVSADSRTWGLLPAQDIVGRVFVRLYPFNELGILPGEARY